MAIPTLPEWFLGYLGMLAVGTAMAFSIGWLLPARWLRYSGVFPGLSANWVSLERAPVSLLGFAIWLLAEGQIGQLWFGFLLVVFGLAMDRLDGRIAMSVLSRLRYLPRITVLAPDGRVVNATAQHAEAKAPLTSDGLLWAWYEDREITFLRVPRKPGSRRYKRKRVKKKIHKQVLLDEWIHRLTPYHTRLPMFCLERHNTLPYRGLHLRLTGLGEWLDPLVDKICFLPVFVFLACAGFLHWPAALAMVAIDLFGTVLRRPFDTTRLFGRLQKYVRQAKASSFGKSKVGFQIATLLAVMPATANWLSADGLVWSYWLVSGLLYLSALAGVVSVLSRLIFWQQLIRRVGLAKATRRLGKFYEHDLN